MKECAGELLELTSERLADAVSLIKSGADRQRLSEILPAGIPNGKSKGKGASQGLQLHCEVVIPRGAGIEMPWGGSAGTALSPVDLFF